MPKSLQAFHFNARKSGQIFKQLCHEKGISQSAIAARTGISYDTVGNVFAGKVQDVTFEKAFKFCVVLGVPIEVYMMLMLKDEEIDFRDDILLYDIQQDDVVPVTVMEATPVPSPVTESVTAVAAAAAAAPAPVQDPHVSTFTRDDISAVVDRLDRRHAAEIAELKAQHRQELDLFERHYEDAQQLIRQLIGRKE